MSNRKIVAAAVAATAALALASCGTEASRVSHNVSQEADNFRIERRVVVINTITDTPLLEVRGRISIEDRPGDDQLEITIQTGPDEFKKHLAGLPPTVAYVVEDLQGADVSSYRYQISYLPEAIVPVEFVDGSR